MDRFTVTGDCAAAVHPEGTAAQIPEGVSICIDITAGSKLYTANGTFINVVVDDLNILASFSADTPGAAAEQAAIFHQNILAVHKK